LATLPTERAEDEGHAPVQAAGEPQDELALRRRARTAG